MQFFVFQYFFFAELQLQNAHCRAGKLTNLHVVEFILMLSFSLRFR